MRRSVPPGMAKPRQVATVLEEEIRSGRLAYGDRLQSENELVHRFSVSRATIRKGLEKLSGRGLITTRVGIGSFVTYDGRQMDDALGWAKALSKAGAKLETRILRFDIVEDEDLARKLDLACIEFVALDRVRIATADGHGVSLERSRLPLIESVADLPEIGLRDGSLSKSLFARGLVPAKGEEWAELECLSDEDAAVLSTQPGAPFLKTRRLVRQANGRVIEYVTSLLNPAHFALRLEF